jgi:hypothetical protein
MHFTRFAHVQTDSYIQVCKSVVVQVWKIVSHAIELVLMYTSLTVQYVVSFQRTVCPLEWNLNP